MMIAAKNGATTTATTVRTGQKARGPDNFIVIDQISIQR
jgi:septum formation inhibitor MinC